jgi:hypothetical protein
MTDDPYFKVGYQVDRYYELEEDFLKVLKYMPLEIYNTSEAREKATSTNLADLLLRIGCVVLNVWTLYTSDEFLYSLLII